MARRQWSVVNGFTPKRQGTGALQDLAELDRSLASLSEANCLLATVRDHQKTGGMTGVGPTRQRRFTPRTIRLLIYLFVVLGFAAWKFIPRRWDPALTIETAHYRIASTATREQTEEIAGVVEILYSAYSNRFSSLPGFRFEHPKLKLILYKDRKEMRRINSGLGWAEAFYRRPYCRAYYSAEERNPYHWMLHEAVHQLNEEVAQVNPAKWLEEGIAEYFSTSRFEGGELRLGQLDPDTYPVWWIDELATAPDLEQNLSNGSVIPLGAIVRNRGGPGMRRHFNLYYLHWWTLTHFVFESPEHQERAVELFREGGGLDAFEKIVGPIETVENDWHRYVRQLKVDLAAPLPLPQ
jgi:hypothetical protein